MNHALVSISSRSGSERNMANIHKILETPRFNLKPLDEGNATQFAELCADPEVVKTLMSDWSTTEKRLANAKKWIGETQTHGIWGAFDRNGIFGKSGEFFGFCGVEEPLSPGGIGPSIFYAFSRLTWGHGVATEVVNTIISHQFLHKDIEAVEALVYSGLNPASSRVLEKSGMRLIGRYPLAGYVGEECIPTIQFELWRIENAAPQNANQCLRDAAFKIGQFVGDKISTKDEMYMALLDASATSGLVSDIGESSVMSIIDEFMVAGMAETGWLHYRIMKENFDRSRHS